jgi:RNA polymerase sigma-70 factor (ECF subfamily)
MMNSDTALIRAILLGDKDAFSSLVRRYHQNVYALALSMVRDPDSAEDITQESFITAFTRLSDLREPNAFAAWLRRISVNTARMWLRKQIGRESTSDMDRLSDSKPGEERGLHQEVVEALAVLSEKQREAAVLCYMDGISRKDAARFLSVKESTLRKRLHDAKRLLQRRIVEAAERNMEEHFLPRGFERRCICACERALDAETKG